ncbi:exopolyphosphatase [Neisseria meningitidis]|nr:exopolyphosphatase [Neisseria meningitidis]
MSLRLAALFCHSRLPLDLPPQTQLRVDENNHSFILRINAQWLEQHPLIADALDYESAQWQKIDMPFSVQAQ